MAEPDPGALSPEQLQRLRDWKIQTRVGNEAYLRSHPQVGVLLSGFIREVLLKRPENIREFAAGYFSDPTLADRIRGEMRVSGEDLAEEPQVTQTAET